MEGVTIILVASDAIVDEDLYTGLREKIVKVCRILNTLRFKLSNCILHEGMNRFLTFFLLCFCLFLISNSISLRLFYLVYDLGL